MKLLLLTALLLAGTGAALLQDPKADAVRRGRYLVHDVAMCVQCHSPRDEQGELIDQELLAGARMPVRSPFAQTEWAFRAPRLAGLPGGWSEDELASFLQTGKSPTGRTPRAPMPPFGLTEEDARAVAAYLASLE
jgi:mono/diheme cytochrome c family protein